MEVQNHRELKSLTLVQILGSKNPALYIPIDFLSCPFAVELLREPMRRQYKCVAKGPAKPDRGEGALCVEMGFNMDISWESRCNIEINV